MTHRPSLRGRFLLAALLLAACGQPTGQPGDEVASVEQFLSVCQGSQTLPGIDVSSYQGTIDWAKVAGAGIKWGYTKATENLGYQDAYFNANWSGMKAHGIARGAYHFFHPNVSGKQQADYYLNFVGTLDPGDLPPMLDWEISGGATAATAAANAQAFIDEIQARTGRTTVIYTSPGIWSGFGITQSFGQYPLWVAHYLYCTGGTCCPTMPSGWTKWIAWQWSDKGSVPGISGAVDMDLFNGSMSDLTTFGGGACNGPVGQGLGSGGPVSGPCGSAAPATTAPTGCGTIGSGLGLSKGQAVTSCDGRFSFVMQSDGNLVEYANGIPLWASHTTPDGAAAVMQSDGNLVVYSSTGCPLWASNTAGHTGAHFAVQDDGNLVVYDTANKPLWASGTGSIGATPTQCGTLAAAQGLAPGQTLAACGGCFNLVMQSDGNLVVYKKGGGSLWSSATAMTSGYTVETQTDGNVVLYSKQGCSLWSTNTGGHTGARLAMQDDGNLVVYDTANKPLWASGSVSCMGGCNCNPPPPPPPPADAGTPPPPPDAGTPAPDAGTPPPAELDAGSMDAGTTPPADDAGVDQPVDDGGSESTTPPSLSTSSPKGAVEPEPLTPVKGGCGCNSGSQGLTVFGLAALALLRRRRIADPRLLRKTVD